MKKRNVYSMLLVFSFLINLFSGAISTSGVFSLNEEYANIIPIPNRNLYIKPSPVEIEEAIDDVGVIGTDDREVVDSSYYPQSAIVYIEVWYDDDHDGYFDHGAGGTGFIVGENTLLTAAHVLYDMVDLRIPDFEYDKVFIYTGVNGSVQDGKLYELSEYYMPSGYSSKQSSGYDWCVLRTTENISDGNGKFTPTNAGRARNLDVITAGYPASDDNTYYQYCTTGIYNYYNTREFSTDLDAGHGQSGSPVYYMNGEEAVVVGVFTGCSPSISTNFGTQITTEVLNKISQFETTASNAYTTETTTETITEDATETTITTTQTIAEIIKFISDLNNDGAVNVTDFILFKKAIMYDDVVDIIYPLPDINGDGKINAADLIYLKRSIAGWENYPII